jgi:Zn-dependent protease
MTTSGILLVLLRLLLIMPAIILHEVSHGYVAYLLGDPTAKYSGRLTLNPVKHIDLFGTIILPAFMFIASGGQFALGYAKPVPINPRLMRRTTYKNGMLLTGAAGPLTNIALAIVSGLLFRLLEALGVNSMVLYIVAFFTLINLVLAFFNLIPIPPLDGSRIVQRFLSPGAWQAYSRIEPYGFVIVILLIFVLPDFLHVDILSNYLAFTVYPLANFLGGANLLPSAAMFF